jgi:hypothetical protein
MNRWECEEPGCKSIADGVGGAAGLVAIGWFFRPGPTILCPAHRPDRVPCRDGGAPCPVCAGRRAADAARTALEGAGLVEPRS